MTVTDTKPAPATLFSFGTPLPEARRLIDPFAAMPSPLLTPEVTEERMLVTPPIATEWLALPVLKRKIYPAHVTKLGRDMKGGRWLYNGQPVQRTYNGGVLNGRHRLLACIEADTPFDTRVVNNLPPESQSTMDIGRNRGMGDHLELGGKKNAAILGALIRLGLLWTQGYRGNPGSSAEPTHAEQLEFFALLPRQLQEAANFASTARGSFKFILPRVYGMMWLLYTGINDIAAHEFLGRVSVGDNIGVGHPAHTLRARMMSERERGKNIPVWKQLALANMAWNHFRHGKGKTIAKLQLPEGGLKPSNFPEPL